MKREMKRGLTPFRRHNGSGKSTLLKILAGLIGLDEGEITRRKQTRIGYVTLGDPFEEGAAPMPGEVKRGLTLFLRGNEVAS
jgi:ABC-type Mn2+/Zn2+ transport system ATPase subunit